MAAVIHPAPRDRGARSRMGELRAAATEFRVLGSLEVERDGRLLEVGGPRIRLLLAVLLAAGGRVVTVPALVDALWGPDAGRDAERTVRTYVSRLRKALESDGRDAGGRDGGTPHGGGPRIVTQAPGYALRGATESLDAVRFEHLASGGRQALRSGDAEAAAGLLAEALGLWRDEPYAEFGDVGMLVAEGRRLAQRRLTALQDRIEADLATGQGPELVAELESLTRRHRGDERLCGQLITALYRAGRQADALEAFTRARRILADTAGLAPSPALLVLHRRVLAQDPGLLAPRTGSPTGAAADRPTGGPLPAEPPPPAGRTPRPAQLPPGVAAFAGRRAALDALDALLPGPERPAAGVGICVVSGPAGVGKSTLAVHWAHRVATHFPDGQLYFDLHTGDPRAGDPHTGDPRAEPGPAERLRGVLHALGVPTARLPAGRPGTTATLDALAGLYRSTLAGRRMLVVLDGARSAAQVRPLLPGTPGCVVVVTCRELLAGLIAGYGAQLLPLGPLSRADARRLLTGRLGAARTAAEPQAVTELIDRCGRLPRTLAELAARAAARPGRPLRAFVRELRDGPPGRPAQPPPGCGRVVVLPARSPGDRGIGDRPPGTATRIHRIG